MIRTFASLVLLGCALLASTAAQNLPAWSAEDRARLKKGEIIAGAGILVDDPASSPSEPLPKVAPEPEVPPLEPAELEPDYDPKEIPQEYLSVYFETKPDSYLIDPQRLLSMQESLDREGFLEYHADDSAVDIRLYLFDAQQQIPAPYTLAKLVEDRYAKGPLTAVLFCFLGDPTRNQLAMGGAGASGILTEDVRQMLEGAQMKAMEKSDPAAQVESFVVQLSIRLYWLEKEKAGFITNVEGQGVSAEASKATGRATSPDRTETSSGTQQTEREASGAYAKFQPYLLYVVVCLFGVAAGMAGLWMGWRVWRMSRTYHFPVLDIPERLGADYAAGVGAVLSFYDKQGSPSAQRDQVPDYLTRM